MAELSFTFPSIGTSGVSSVNEITGAVVVTGTQNLDTQTSGQVITVRGPDLTIYASTANLVTTSGHLQEQIDDIDPFPSLVGIDGIVVTSGNPDTLIAGFYTEFLAASGSLSAEIDSDISTHASISDAHHSRYTDGEAVSATESSRYTLSGTLSSEIDSDITTHTSDSSAHHTRYQKSENDALVGSDGITTVSGSDTIEIQGFYTEFVAASGTLSSEIDSDIVTHTLNASAHHTRYQKSENDALIGSDGITVVSGSDTIDLQGFRSEFVSTSGSLQTGIDEKVSKSGDIMTGTLDIQNDADLIVDGDATVSGILTVGSGGAPDPIINWSIDDTLKFVMGVDGGDEYKFKIATSDGLGFGSALEIDSDGDVTTINGFYPDGGFYPRRISQASPPVSGGGITEIDNSELVMWYDTVGSGVHILYNDPVQGVVTWSGII